MLRPVFISLVLLLAPFAHASVEQAGSAEALVAGAAQELAVVGEDQVADTVLQTLDVPAIARFTLGRHGRSLDDASKTRFTEAFEAYLRRQIVSHASEFSGVQMSVTKISQRNARDAVVTTLVERPGDRVTLRWRVIERGGKWSVVDLEFAGIWLAIEQRAQVSAILDRPGATIETVIAQFE